MADTAPILPQLSQLSDDQLHRLLDHLEVFQSVPPPAPEASRLWHQARREQTRRRSQGQDRQMAEFLSQTLTKIEQNPSPPRERPAKGLALYKTDGTLLVSDERTRLHDVVEAHKGRLCQVDLPAADLRDVDLSNADLRQANLRGANLAGANLSGARLYQADLRQADLSHATLADAKLEAADLAQATLYRASLARADLKDASLYEAWLTETDLTEALLGNTDLEGAHLERADLYGATLHNVHLFRANLCATKLLGARLHQTELGWARFSGLDAGTEIYAHQVPSILEGLGFVIKEVANQPQGDT